MPSLLVSCAKLFSFAPPLARLNYVAAVVFAAAHGCVLPLSFYLFRLVFLHLFKYSLDPAGGLSTEYHWQIHRYAALIAILVISVFCQHVLAALSIPRLSWHLRTRLLRRILQKSYRSFVENNTSSIEDHQYGGEKQVELPSVNAATHAIIRDVDIVETVLHSKLPMAVQCSCAFLLSYTLAFYIDWRLTATISVVPLFVLGVVTFMAQLTARRTLTVLSAESHATAIAAQAISLIRVVTAYCSAPVEVSAYRASLANAFRSSVATAFINAVGQAIIAASFDAMEVAVFLYGLVRIQAGALDSTQVFAIFLVTASSAFTLVLFSPSIKDFGVASAAAARIITILSDESDRDPSFTESGSAIIPNTTNGAIEFRNVQFSYSASAGHGREDEKTVLNNFNLQISAGHSEAFVGPSGCGKTTAANLLLRLYDPDAGAILLDGVDIRDLDVRWLRSVIGVVPQHPVLFMMSVRDNIALGAGDISGNASLKEEGGLAYVSDDTIVACAKIANAHDFIMKLPQNYNTLVGEHGAQLSGGQKQRICIARALVRDPKILILDEATSSLDATSEHVVSSAIERASKGRTTIVIAHRLSTVRKLDSISYIRDGMIVERGLHDQLVSKGEMYGMELKQWRDIDCNKHSPSSQVAIDEEHKKGMDGDLYGERKGNYERPADGNGESDEDGTVAVDLIKYKDERKEDERLEAKINVFSRTIRYARPEWHIIAFGILGVVGISLRIQFKLVLKFSIFYILLENPTWANLLRLLRWYLLSVTVGVLGAFLQESMLNYAGERLTRRLRLLSFQNILSQDMSFFDESERNSTGALTGLLAADVVRAKDLIFSEVRVYVSVFVIASCGIGITLFYSIPLAARIVPILVGSLAFHWAVGVASTNILIHRIFPERSRAWATLAEIVGNIYALRTFCVENIFQKQFDDSNTRADAIFVRRSYLDAISHAVSESASHLILIIGYLTIEAFISSPEDHEKLRPLLLGSMASFYAAFFLSRQSVFSAEIYSSRASSRKVYDLLETRSEIDPRSNAGQRLNGSPSIIEFRNVSFRYPSRQQTSVLRKFSLKIERGQTIAIVGESGQGKSTILSLLLRLYDVDSGAILVDGVDLRDINLRHLRAKMGMIFQEPDLFDRSVLENIAYGLPSPENDDEGPIPMTFTNGQIEAAARSAHAHEFVSRLPQRYETVVGRRGERLSGGERQRVALARCLMRQPAVLLLDEATSALDQESERLIKESLEREMRAAERISIVVAHRLSTIRNANMIIVVHEGAVVEHGTHDELMALDGAYLKLVDAQRH